MDDILSRFSINCHSSIRYAGAMTVWFDPFRVADAPCDADVVFVTHDHYDHFSPEDIHRVMKPGAVLVLPETCVAAALRAGFASAQLLPVRPGEAYTVKALPFPAGPAHNLGKTVHPPREPLGGLCGHAGGPAGLCGRRYRRYPRRTVRVV